MPLAPAPSRQPELSFESSAACELLFLLKWLSSGEAERRTGRPDHLSPAVVVPASIVERVEGIWEDGLPFWELLVVAHEAGALFGPLATGEIEDRLGAACESVSLEPALRSEPEEDRTVILERLARLCRDTRFRRRYLRLLSELWAVIEEEWSGHQLPTIARVAQECRQKQERNQPWQPLLRGAETASAILDAGWERAREEGTATVALCAYGGSLVLDLPGLQLFAMTIKGVSSLDRDRAAQLARRLRALADPTRLVLAEILARQPRTVGELALDLGVSQPTVSSHIKLLREAGLVTGSDGDRRQLAISEESLAGLLAEVRALLGGS